MNYGRLVAAAVAATVVDAVYGLLIYGQLLAAQFDQYPAIFRAPDAQAAYIPGMFAGIFIGMLAATWIYAKGYEGRGAVREGIRFGAVVGIFVIGYFTMVNYSIMNIGRGLAVSMAIAGFIEWLIIGVTIGAVYRTATQPRRNVAAV